MDEFNKNAWLRQLANSIKACSTVDGNNEEIIFTEDLEPVLQFYFPKFKLIDNDRTSTNTGNNSPELASHIAAIIQQSEDEDDTGTSATDVQVVSI